MDIAVDYNSQLLTFAVSVVNGDLTTDDGLRTAIIISLFTDRRAAADDSLPGGANDMDRRGCWQDDYLDNAGDSIGSRLWLLNREKETDDVLGRAKTYILEALRWLVTDGIATSVDATCVWGPDGKLAVTPAITRADGSRYQETFMHTLEAA